MAEDYEPIEDNDPEKVLRDFLAQFGIQPGPDGQIDLTKVMASMQPLMTNFATQMAGYGATDGASGMNWSFISATAHKVAAAAGDDPTPTPAQRAADADAAGLAELWLDEATAFERLATSPASWSRADWINETFAIWQRLVRPIVTNMTKAIADLAAQGPEDPQMAQLQAMMQPMLRQSAAAMLGSQLGTSLGHLATLAVSASDLGLPLIAPPRTVLLTTNVAAFAAGLEQPEADVTLFLAVREAARQRLFASVAWLGPQLLALVEHYARDIHIDPVALEQAIEGGLNGVTDPADLERLGVELSGKLFTPAITSEQAEVLARLETLLALVEGWVDDVSTQIIQRWMPNAASLVEAVRRRRAAGGPAEQALKDLVGLELRPRRTRDAANLWAAVRTSRGLAERDAAWDHPDRVPTATDLDDPLGYAQQEPLDDGPDAMDEALAKLLNDEQGS